MIDMQNNQNYVNKHYEYNFYYEDVLIKNITIFKSKIIHLPQCLT